MQLFKISSDYEVIIFLCVADILSESIVLPEGAVSQSAAWSTCPRSAANLAHPTKCKQAPCDVTLHPSGPVGCGCLWACPLLWRSPAGQISISILYSAPEGPEFNSKAGRLGHFSAEIGGSPRDCVECSPKYVRITDDSKLAKGVNVSTNICLSLCVIDCHRFL